MKIAILRKVNDETQAFRFRGLHENQIRLKAQYMAPPGEYILEFYSRGQTPYLTERVTIQDVYRKIDGAVLPEKGKYAGKKNELHNAPNETDGNTTHFSTWRKKKPKVVNEKEDDEKYDEGPWEPSKKKDFSWYKSKKQSNKEYKKSSLTKEEQETLDELSSSTMNRYIKKASSEVLKDAPKSKKRLRGIAKAEKLKRNK